MGVTVSDQSMPAYQRIADDLRTQIAGGRLKPGDRVPSEAELRATYGVSTTVVKQAMLVLTTAGLVEGRRGSGRFVTGEPDPDG
jgi:DNA-binding GntR family transcriptional regulator